MTQGELLPVAHDSTTPHRLTKVPGRHNPERVYLARWKAENRRRFGVNHGYGTLEWILSTDGGQTPARVSRRDAQVAASVVQWLGTNVGLGFILGCERRIEELRRTDRERALRPSLSEAQEEEEARRPTRRRITLAGRRRRYT